MVVMDDTGSAFARQVCLSPDNTVHFATRIMAEYHVGVVVLKRRGVVVGLVTERLIRTSVEAKGRDAEITPLSAIMMQTPNLATVVPAWHPSR